ncbi:MAG: hypothetical protein QOJ34_342 [Pseudonocardiales bacterium]|jgi:hypothetical protein|nr:hypothetical protein [Pseudonocardiales bacterium]
MLSRLLGGHPENSTGYRAGVSSESGAARVFRLPLLAYLAVLFLLFGTAPLAFTTHGYESENAHLGPQTLLLLVPAAAAVFIARWATIVDATGVTVRAAFGKRVLPWDEIRGLSLDGGTVYAVLADGAVRLPCVHVQNLAAVARASGGRLPDLPDPAPKFAPQRRRRR